MTSMVAFSIVLPAYNNQGHLDQALDSVLKQTLTDWECIVVDDASPDVRLTVPQDERFRLLRAERNLGIAGARNAGLTHAWGDRLCFLDHDDRYAPERLEAVVDVTDPVVLCVPSETTLRLPVTASSISSGFAPHLGNVTVRRDVCPRFDERFRVSDDLDWWIRLASSQPISVVTGDFYQFQYHDEIPETRRELRLVDSLLLLQVHSEFFRHNPRARAFRWSRVAAYSDSLPNRAKAILRSVSARPTRAGATQAWRLVRDLIVHR